MPELTEECGSLGPWTRAQPQCAGAGSGGGAPDDFAVLPALGGLVQRGRQLLIVALGADDGEAAGRLALPCRPPTRASPLRVLCRELLNTTAGRWPRSGHTPCSL